MGCLDARWGAGWGPSLKAWFLMECWRRFGKGVLDGVTRSAPNFTTVYQVALFNIFKNLANLPSWKTLKLINLKSFKLINFKRFQTDHVKTVSFQIA